MGAIHVISQVEVLVLVASQRDPPWEFPLDTLLLACFLTQIQNGGNGSGLIPKLREHWF